MLKLIAVRVFQAIVSPTRRRRPVTPLRSFVRLPVVFDLVSLILQARDIGRVRRVKESFDNEDPYFQMVQNYNSGVTQAKLITTTRRAEEIYEVLSVPYRDKLNEQLLIIGPRNALELLIAWCYGYRWRNITGADLYSVNPRIKVTNMEDMAFADASFDAVTTFATLAYAKNTLKALQEMTRVLRPGGRLAFSATHDPGAHEWPESVRTGTEIYDMLRQCGIEVYFHTRNHKTNSEGRAQTTHVFGCRKPLSAAASAATSDDFAL